MNGMEQPVAQSQLDWVKDADPVLRAARAEAFWLLARAFMPPPRGWRFGDWYGLLITDLEELSGTLQLDLAALRAAAQQAIDLRRDVDEAGGPGADWLVAYASLFLTPPVPAPLNAGLLLEGSLAGSVAQQALACYQAGGFAPSDDFHDLPDHVAVQLEFMARMLDQQTNDGERQALADSFAHHFLRAWAPLLQQACQRAAAQEPAGWVYAALAGIVLQLVSAQDESLA